MKQFDPPPPPPPKNKKQHTHKKNTKEKPSHGKSTFNFNPIKYSLSLSLCVSLSHLFLIPRQDLDAHPFEPATFSAYDGPKLCLFQPVTEEVNSLLNRLPKPAC